MIFSYNDYESKLSKGQFSPPNAFSPYNNVNKNEFIRLELASKSNNNSVEDAFNKIRDRVDRKYFYKIYPKQSRILDYSSQAFPAYRFILPEILTNDWLALVDWHKRFSRDHGLHQPLCSYIILKLLRGDENGPFIINGSSLLNRMFEQIRDNGVYIKEYLKQLGIEKYPDGSYWLEMKNELLWKELIIESAFVAAVFHDLGYPWQYINSLNSKLVNVGIIKNEISNECENIVNLFRNRMLFAPFNNYEINEKICPVTWSDNFKKIVSRTLNETHGLPGAIGFLYLFDIISDYPNKKIHPIKQFCIEWASMAIMMHDLCSIYWGTDKARTIPENPHLRVKFSTDPLSFIITLADLIQEFERPVATFQKHDMESIPSIYYDYDCIETELKLENDRLKIIYKYRISESAGQKNLFIREKRENEKYFDHDFGYLEYSSLGLSSIKMVATTI